jgi:uncharacterized membrane protein HdeD (DUF308 family)
MTTLFRKWWILLLQGILLIIISFIFFNNPTEVLAVISFWVGLLTLITGVIGLAAYFMVEKSERDSTVLLWSAATLIFGILLVTKVGLTMKLITVLFGIWILMTGIWLTSAGWQYRNNGAPGWLMLIAGILSVIAGVAIIFDVNVGAVWISTLLGVQTLLSGLGFVMLAFLRRKVVSKLESAKSLFGNQ